MRVALLFICFASSLPAVADVPSAVLTAQQARVDLVKQVSPSVVCVFGRDGGGGGSGVLISPDGFALTNFHVTNGAGDVMRCGLDDGKLYDAIVVGIDPTGDVALIKLLGRDDFPTATLGDSDALSVGEWVYAMGNPFLLAADFTPTVTYGIVSGLHRYQYPAGTFLEYTDCIQFDTSLNPGNSGGPLFNAAGELVGINGRGSFEKRGRVNVGAGYAISINQIKHFLDHLKSGRVVDHGTLNATVSTAADGAVRISSILEDSDAYRRGLRSGDEIVSFAGRPIRSANEFQNVLGIFPTGRTLPLTYRRGSETSDIRVQLSNAHRESELMKFSETPPDGENPQPGQPEEQPGDAPGDAPEKKDETPKLPVPHVHAKEELPAELKGLVVKKPGFANYRFNEIEQRRVLAALAPLGDLSRFAPGAVLSGTRADDRPFELRIAGEGVGLKLGDPNRAYLQPLDPDSKLLDEPPGSAGFLASLDLFRSLLAARDKLASFAYFGSEPLDGDGPTVDVLTAEDRGGTLRLYVRREDGKLAGYDFRLAAGAERCRVRFDDGLVAASSGGFSLPGRWTVSSGPDELLTLRVERIAPLAGRR